MYSSGHLFNGAYRKEAKTSIVRTDSGAIKDPEIFANLNGLIGSFVLYGDMARKYRHLIIDESASKEAKAAIFSGRIEEEKRNVEVDCWIYHARIEGDNDIHVIVGSSPMASEAVFLNIEISGLPTDGDDLEILKAVREQFAELIGRPLDKIAKKPEKYQDIRPPLKMRVRGSLFFDGDQMPGEVGSVRHKSKTVWEIHPVISVVAL